MKTISATYKVTTPMFLGGADHQPDGIRLSAFKGALRFWWRALNWRRVYQEANANQKEALKQLHKEECDLFGAAYMDGKGGQGNILLRLSKCTEKPWSSDAIIREKGCQYLLGQGLYSPGSKKKKVAEHMTRKYTATDYRFQVDAKVKAYRSASNKDSNNSHQNYSKDAENQLIEVLKVLGLMGGLGSRARKGFGSLKIIELKIVDRKTPNEVNNIALPQNRDEYRDLLSSLFMFDSTKENSLPPFTALSKFSIAYITNEGSSWQSVLNDVGTKMQLYRGWGRNGEINGKPALQIFKRDHDYMLDVTEGADEFLPPKRLVFGIPHNYRFSSKGQGVSIEIDDSRKNRRASPLFIHIHQFENTFIAVQFILPAQFFPENAVVVYSPTQRGLGDLELDAEEEDINWSTLTNYLEQDTYNGTNGKTLHGFVKRETVFRGEKC